MNRNLVYYIVCKFCEKTVGIFLCCLFSVVLYSCANANYSNVQNNGIGLSLQYDSLRQLSDNYADRVDIRYAKGLKVEYTSDSVHIYISDPEVNTVKNKSYTLVTVPRKPAGLRKRFVTTTALQLGNFEVLGMESSVVGINSLRNIFSSKVRSQLEEGKTKRLGKEGNFDVETVMLLKPDYIFVSSSKYGGFETLRNCGISLIPHHGYKETDPLGQAEWIKLIGLLTGETRKANAIFDHIEKEYLTLKKKVVDYCKGKKLPTVLSGRQLRDGWYVMGGKSHMARLFEDAGADYVMKYLNDTGGITLDFETVYAKGLNADFWQTDGSFDGDYTLDAMAVEDARYADIKAHKEGKVIFCNLSKTPYRELAGVAPHLMLADFVKAIHPELLPDYQPTFYDFIK